MISKNSNEYELLLGSSRLSGQLGYLFKEESTYRKLQKPHKLILYSTK